MKKRRPPSHESTAYHEAAHALVAYLIGQIPDEITIEETEAYRGLTLIKKEQPLFSGTVEGNREKGEQCDGASLVDKLTILHAGIVAQKLLCTKRGVSPKPVRLGRDMREARNSVRHLSKDKQIELFSAAEKRTIELLDNLQNWSTIERIVAELLGLGTLNGPALLKLIPGTLWWDLFSS